MNGRRVSRAPVLRRALLLALSLAAFAATSAHAATPFSYGLPAHVSVPRWALARGGEVHFYPTMRSAAQPTDDDEPGEPPGQNGGQGLEGDLGRRCGGCLGVPVRYYGGPVQHEPEVHVIFWGSNWSEAGGPGPGLRAELLRFYEGLSDSTAGEAFEGVLTQYFDESGRVAPTLAPQRLTTFTDESVPAPAAVSDAKLIQEARAVAANPTNRWTLGPDAQFVIVPAPGASYEASFDDDFCAYHSVVREPATYWTYTFLSYNGEEPFESGCLDYDSDAATSHAEKARRVLSMDASHEYAESATDPAFTAWLDSEGNEIADICSSGDDELANDTWVQGLWDDHLSACSLGDEKPPHVLALTEGASGVGPREASLNATVNPENEGREARYRFEYGPTKAYGQDAPTAGLLSAGSALANRQVSQPLSGLEEGTTYHYRVAATDANAGGGEETTFGEDHTFVPSPWSTGDALRLPGAGQASFGSALVSCSFLPWSCGGVSCAARSSCVAVGTYELDGREVPMADTWDAGQWTLEALPFPAQTGEQVALTGISCASPTACLGVGYEKNTVGVRVPVADRLSEAGGWSASAVPLPSGAAEAGLEGVSCASSSECIAVGLSESAAGAERPYAALWSNGSWSVQAVRIPEGANSVLEGVSCPSAGTCVAAGFSEAPAGVKTALAESWNGATWSLASPKAPSGVTSSVLSAVSCPSPGTCTAVGGYTTSRGSSSLAEHWNGTAWSAQTTANTGFQEELLGVSCPTSDECTAVGNYAPGAHSVAMVQTWNGAGWSAQPSNVDEAQASELHAVSCATGATCAAAGITGWSAAGRSRSGYVEALAEIRYSGPPLTPVNPTPSPQPPPLEPPPEGLTSQALLTPLGSAAPGPATTHTLPAPALRCRVPRLSGSTLKRARERLRQAHCGLGRVKRPRHSRGTLVVRGQSHSAGVSLAADAKVNLTLGTPPRAPARRR